MLKDAPELHNPLESTDPLMLFLKRHRWLFFISTLIKHVPESQSRGRLWRTAYYDLDRDVRVCAPMGLHLLLRWWVWFQFYFMDTSMDKSYVFMSTKKYRQKFKDFKNTILESERERTK